MNQEIQRTIKEISSLVIGKERQITLAVTCLLANGHLLIEDLPGMGKTTLCHALAKVLGLEFSRVQFTSDLLPGDMLGVSIFDSEAQNFRFHKGPIFSQLVLADEINRASPKTQSALLEAMEEKQVSVDGETFSLPKPFFVIGTQNPVHQSGTYPLPESQLDRFLMRIELGYPSPEAEKTMLKQQSVSLESLAQILSPDNLTTIQQHVNQIHASDKLLDYILALVSHTRSETSYPNPLSPRASKAILVAAKAWALIDNRDYVIPEDIQAVVPSVCEHRLRSDYSTYNKGEELSLRLLNHVSPTSM